MMTSYKIVIPTYERTKVLIKKTLKVLEDSKIDPRLVYIFVDDKAQKIKYEQALENNKYNRNIIIGKRGLTNISNFIVDYFPTGERLVAMDDDITGLYKLDNQNKLKRVNNFKQILHKGFKLLEEKKLQLFGFYPVANAYFMQTKKVQPGGINTGLSFIYGAFYGFINDKSLRFYKSTQYKNDYHYSILSYLKYGGVLRFDKLTFKSTIYAKGGNNAAGRTIEKENECAARLQKKYPDLVTFHTKKDGRNQIKFLKQTHSS